MNYRFEGFWKRIQWLQEAERTCRVGWGSITGDGDNGNRMRPPPTVCLCLMEIDDDEWNGWRSYLVMLFEEKETETFERAEVERWEGVTL